MLPFAVVNYQYPFGEDNFADVATVPYETLDHFLMRHPLDRIALIKIDAEGTEAKVLRRMGETLKTHPETRIILEFGPHNQEMAGVNPADFLS